MNEGREKSHRIMGANVGLAIGLTILGAVLIWPWNGSSTADDTTESSAPPNSDTVADRRVVKMPAEPQRLAEYRELAAALGLEYDRKYRYQVWADAKRANKIGVAGEYEMLACAHVPAGGNPFDCLSDGGDRTWETLYAENHDVTLLYRITTSGERSHVKLLKLAEGRVPDLHKR